MSLLSEGLKETERRVTNTFYVPFLKLFIFNESLAVFFKILSDGQRLYFKISVPTRPHF